MAHYSDPTHALLARIAKALERIATHLDGDKEAKAEAEKLKQLDPETLKKLI